MNVRPKPVTIQLVGGLGNQLFGYFAGLAFQFSTDRQVDFDVSELDKGMTVHGADIRSFDVAGTFKKRTLLSRYFTKSKAAISDLLPSFRERTQIFLGLWTSPSIEGGIPSLPTNRRLFIRGYFQNYAAPVRLLSQGFKLQLINPSAWYLGLKASATDEKPIMAHVRRGDYAKLSEELGLLSAGYFVSGIALARKLLNDPSRPVWVFSDDIDAVMAEIKHELTGQIIWIREPTGADPAESLMLMSLGSANVISNSTFSWWSAILSGNEYVIAPSKWFRGKPDPIGLIPESWIRIESEWKD